MPLDLPRDDHRSDRSFPFELLEILDFSDAESFAAGVGLLAFLCLGWFIVWIVITMIDAFLSPSGIQRLGL